MSKKRKIPFSMMPASWGLKGKSRAIAEAEYYYEGEELEKVLAELDAENDDDKEIARLKVDLKNDKLSQTEYEKRVAEIKKEPWVTVVGMGVNPENVVQGYFELDWNEEFVKMLQSAGITGTSDEDVVNKWFNGVCRTVLIQEKADLDYGLAEGEREDVIRRQVTPKKPKGSK
jgi:hypothetical protein